MPLVQGHEGKEHPPGIVSKFGLKTDQALRVPGARSLAVSRQPKMAVRAEAMKYNRPDAGETGGGFVFSEGPFRSQSHLRNTPMYLRIEILYSKNLAFGTKLRPRIVEGHIGRADAPQS